MKDKTYWLLTRLWDSHWLFRNPFIDWLRYEVFYPY